MEDDRTTLRDEDIETTTPAGSEWEVADTDADDKDTDADDADQDADTDDPS